MNWTTRSLAALSLAILVAQACTSSGSEPAPPELVGDWTGDAGIIVSWCERERLDVALHVASDASVSGAVGDAALVDGRLRRNRGALGRSMKIKTDWIISGDLEGPIVGDEGIERDGVNIPFNLIEGRMKGSVHSTGWHVGGRDNMVLTAAGMELEREEGARSRPSAR